MMQVDSLYAIFELWYGNIVAYIIQMMWSATMSYSFNYDNIPSDNFV